jgi:hypothetical protein
MKLVLVSNLMICLSIVRYVVMQVDNYFERLILFVRKSYAISPKWKECGFIYLWLI